MTNNIVDYFAVSEKLYHYYLESQGKHNRAFGHAILMPGA